MSESERNYELKAEVGQEGLAAPAVDYRPRNPKSYRPKIGLIACGGVTSCHLDAYRSAGYDVVGLCDLHQDRAEGRRKEFFPNAFVTTKADELLAHEEIEVVDIATHPEDRAALIEAALKSGKHVLSQKPFVVDLEVGEKLVALADSVGKRLAVNQNGRWAPHFSWMRNAIREGHIGEVLGAHLAIHWNHDWCAGTPFDHVHHLVLYDFAIHWFDILTCLMVGRTPTRVFASNAYAKGQKSKPPLMGQALVEYEGAQATLVFDAFTKFGALDTTFISGTEGTLKSSGPGLHLQEVTLTKEEGSAVPPLEGSWFNDGFHGSMGELLCAIEEGREPTNSARHNLRSLALCFAALKSADTGLPQVPGQVRTLKG